MSPWKWLSKCECGPGKTRTRSRHLVLEPHGNGKRCGIQKENVRCGIKCQCKMHEFGSFCENQHCVVGPWSDPCKDVKDESGCTWGHKKNKVMYQRFIVREVTHEARGSGRKCPKLKDAIICPAVGVCRSFSEWFWGQ